MIQEAVPIHLLQGKLMAAAEESFKFPAKKIPVREYIRIERGKQGERVYCLETYFENDNVNISCRNTGGMQ